MTKDYYEHAIPRYVRFKPHNDLEERIIQVAKSINAKLTPVTWLEGFYSLDADIKVGANPYYKQGWFYGMDVSSGVAINALEIQPSDHVLDLCCAPGTKLRMIAEMLAKCNGTGTITGVDIAAHRMHTCKSAALRSECNRIRLFLADGTVFNVPPPSRIGPLILAASEGSIESSSYLKPFHASKLIRNDHQLQIPSHLYDKVIVDAECTHDGSIAHIAKYNDNNWDGFQAQFLNPDRLNDLERLQRMLLENGFKHLKEGGILVYSTCSSSRLQNEDVVDWLLNKYPSARLERIPDIENVPTVFNGACATATDNLCIRMTPEASKTSGFFVARIRRTSDQVSSV